MQTTEVRIQIYKERLGEERLAYNCSWNLDWLEVRMKCQLLVSVIEQTPVQAYLCSELVVHVIGGICAET